MGGDLLAKIWAQDFVPIFAVGTLWALHALVLDRRQGAIFWVVLLPLCLIQIHFSGLALAATVVLLLLLLRPAVDWPSSVAGVTLAAILALPYFGLQYKTDWIDFKIAAGTVGKQNYQVPDGMTVHPELGSGLPSREPWWQRWRS